MVEAAQIIDLGSSEDIAPKEEQQSIDLDELEEQIFEVDDEKLAIFRNSLKDKGRAIAQEIVEMAASRLSSAK